MLVLVLDTSTPAVAAGLTRVTGAAVDLIAERTTVDGRAHGEVLGPQVAEVLREASVRPSDLTAIVVGLGPGPFTGLRVGLVTAASMGQVLAIPTYGVCSLDGIGCGSTGLDASAELLVATDARRKEIYWARYVDGARVSEPAVGRPADVHAMLGAGPAAAAGDGALLYAEVLGLPVVAPRYPSLRALAELAADRVRSGAPDEPLTPLYLRRPDAVEPASRKAVLP